MEYQRRTIDHLTKYLVHQNLAPKEVTDSLHKSQLSRYRNTEPKEWSGYDLSAMSWNNLELLQDFNTDLKAQKVFQAYGQVCLLLTTILTSLKGFKKELRKNREQILNCVEQVKDTIGLPNALVLLNISRTTYHNWLVELKSKCLDSPFQLCQNRFPNQLTKMEVKQMKDLLLDKQFFYWPISSLYFYSLKSNLLNVSLTSWYKYSHILGVNRPKPIPKKKKRKLGIRASKPNEIWHTDITKVELAIGLKCYVYLLVDNYSRKILNWRVGETVSKVVSSGMVEESFLSICDGLDMNITLMTDGGPENSASEINKINLRKQLRLLMKVALKDIDFSNSLVEAVNKILKNSFLHHFEIYSLKELKRLIEQFIKDYNEIRPHCSLNGLTPDEMYKELKVPKEKLKAQVEAARRARVKTNHVHNCGKCL